VKWLRKLLGREDGPAADMAAGRARWVILDCESSGLDPHRDRLLSIGAVAVEGGRIRVAESFSAVLRQAEASSGANILVHGISDSEQRHGGDAAMALRDFNEFASGATLVAFHASFDRTLLRRAAASCGLRFSHRWLDLAALAPALYPKRAATCRALDDWLAALNIPAEGRHDALCDAYGTAQLFIVLLAEARVQGAHSVDAILQVSNSRAWLS